MSCLVCAWYSSQHVHVHKWSWPCMHMGPCPCFEHLSMGPAYSVVALWGHTRQGRQIETARQPCARVPTDHYSQLQLSGRAPNGVPRWENAGRLGSGDRSMTGEPGTSLGSGQSVRELVTQRESWLSGNSVSLRQYSTMDGPQASRGQRHRVSLRKKQNRQPLGASQTSRSGPCA